MMRYLKIYLYFLRFSFSKAMEFRFDYFFRIFMDLIYYAVNIILFKVLYLHTPFIGSWREDQMMVFISGFLFLDGIMMTVLATNLWWFPIYINRGDLDYYLTRPISPLFFLSLREFAANSLVNLLGATVIFIWALSKYQDPIVPWKLGMFIFFLINGVFLYYMMNMIFLMVVFWTQSPRGLGDLYFTVSHAMERPDRIYGGLTRKVFTTILPFCLFASYPARIFMEEFDWRVPTHIIIVTICLWIIFYTIWRKGLRNYGSASS